MKVLELENIYFRQGNFILKDINLNLEEGEVVALTGKTGSGKSTLVSLIGNANVADSGIIRYFGKELYENEKSIRKDMSVVYDRINFNREMRARRLAKEIKRFEKDFDLAHFDKYLEIFELDPSQRIRYFSTEMRRKYMLSLALSRNPKLLVMDDITKDVEQESRTLMWKVIEEYRHDRGLSIIFTTRNKDDIENSRARVVELEGGKLL